MIGKLERKIEKAERKMFRRHFYARRSYYPPAPPPPPPSYGGGYGGGGYGSGGYGGGGYGAYPPISPMLPQERYNPAANLYGPMAIFRQYDRDGNGMITEDGKQFSYILYFIKNKELLIMIF